jgi:phosphonate transport system substrate-binding protein
VPFTRLDLNGIRVGIPNKDSITGFAVPLATYMIGTRSLASDEDFFTEYKNLEAALAAFTAGDLDAFFGWTASDEKGTIAGAGALGLGDGDALSFGGRSVEIKLPWKSPLLRFGPHAVRRDLSGEARSALMAFLQAPGDELLDIFSIMGVSDLRQLIPANQSEYELAIQTVKAAASIAK